MSAIVIASVVAAVTSRSLAGDDLGLHADVFRMGDARELFLYVGLALLIVILAVGFLRLIDRVDRLATANSRLGILRPIGLGLLVAVVGFFDPRLLGTGQEFANQMIQWAAGDPLTLAWWTLALLAVGKVLATTFTLTSGASGGAFMPSLFMGATVGAGFARWLQPVWQISVLHPGALAVVGMATMYAAVARAPLTSILLVFETTGARDYFLVLPLMLSATLATFLADRIQPLSVYTQVLRRKGIELAVEGEVDLLDTVRVGDVDISHQDPVATPEMNLAHLQDLFDRHRTSGLPVVYGDELVGIVTTSDLSRAGGPDAKVLVNRVMTPAPTTVTRSTPVSHALERMSALGISNLPVVDENQPRKLTGMFRREDAVEAYHKALAMRTSQDLTRQRLQQRTEAGAVYYEFRLPPGSLADGKAVREVEWPDELTLVAVRRDRHVLVPNGATVLVANDVVTAFGTEASREQVIAQLNASAEEPTAELSPIDLEKALMAEHGAQSRPEEEPSDSNGDLDLDQQPPP